MNVILLTLGVSIILALIFLLGFLWATRRGQYDDLTRLRLFLNPIQLIWVQARISRLISL